MGLGSDPCGASPCGLDSQITTEITAKGPPAALVFDGSKRDFELDSDGLYRAAHPIDAKVFLILRTALGSIRSARDVGQGVSSIEYIDTVRIRSIVEDRVRSALSGLVDAGQIQIQSIEIDTSVRTRIAFAVNYQNLVSARLQRASIS